MSYENLKIGKLVQTVLKPLIISKATKQEISKMQELEYSKATFGIQYPLLLKTTSFVAEKHYYSDLFTINGETYRLCCEWYETASNNDRPYVEQWINEHETMVTEASTDFFEDFEEDGFSDFFNKVTIWTPNGIEIEAEQNTYYKNIEIPEGVKYIESKAFYECKNLEEVIIPKSVKYIGESAFERCENLKEIVIPEGVKRIESKSFYLCENLEEVIIPKSVKYIGESAFEWCENLKEIVIPEGVEQIGSKAFKSCKNLRRVVIPSSVKRIDSEAFHMCENLIEVIISANSNMEYIGESAFEACKSLRNIIIPDRVRVIEAHCFHFCQSLEKVYLPGCVESLGICVFTYCTNLQSINIPYNVTILPDYFIYGCTNLKKVDINENIQLKFIMNGAFKQCSSLFYFPGDKCPNLRYIDQEAFDEKLIFYCRDYGVKNIAQQQQLKVKWLD